MSNLGARLELDRRDRVRECLDIADRHVLLDERATAVMPCADDDARMTHCGLIRRRPEMHDVNGVVDSCVRCELHDEAVLEKGCVQLLETRGSALGGSRQILERVRKSVV